MIKGRHHWFLYPFFVWYGWMRMKRHFKKIHLSGTVSETGLPILVISNHFSWWDGFFIASLNRKNFHKKFHVMMLEDQLKKNWFFQHTGAFSVRKNSKGIIQSLTYASELLQNPDNLVTYFPQGQFESINQEKLQFEKGVEWLLKNLKNEVEVIFVANQVDYFESANPYLFIHFETYDFKGKNLQEIEDDFNSFYRTSSLKNINLKNT
ncbi:lysophospholipid acyltransferase family protein [Mariniphaga sp.]|uniref:lysophospholipid acyltransferase family protein n=1 Tax=Mariniphaga sp. TaxID=1954475 RepID=UPI0035656DBD